MTLLKNGKKRLKDTLMGNRQMKTWLFLVTYQKNVNKNNNKVSQQ